MSCSSIVGITGCKPDRIIHRDTPEKLFTYGYTLPAIKKYGQLHNLKPSFFDSPLFQISFHRYIPIANGIIDQIDTVLHPKLLQKIGTVMVDRAGTQVQLLGDVL